MELEIEIIKIVPPGDGFGIYKGKAVFVPATTIGDRVRVSVVKENKKIITAALQEVLVPSPDRIDPPCVHYSQCGGCSLMHLSDKMQLDLKKQMLIETFASHRIQIDPEIVPSPQTFEFRYRTQLKIRNGHIGFSRRKGTEVIDIPHCRILSPGLMNSLTKISQHQLADGECHLLEAIDSGVIAGLLFLGAERITLPGFSESIVEDYGFGPMEFPVDAFAQSNPYITGKITQALVEFCKATQQVVELYCGCGTFSIPVGKQVERLFGFDAGEKAIQTARDNARRNHLTNMRFKTTNLDKIGKLPRADTIIVDPPRKGLSKKVIKMVGRSKASKLLYVSCNPATLARDIESLSANHGFKLNKITGYDMYCHSTHLEVLAVLDR